VADDPLLAPLEGAERREVGGVVVECVRAGEARLAKITYPRGYRWSTHLAPEIPGELCMHAHVGFLVRGRMQGEYADGCTFDFTAPAAVVVEPGHDAWVVGDEDAIFLQVDFEGATAARFGLEQHTH
jgi:hypothetical protein